MDPAAVGMPSRGSAGGNMGTPFFVELKRQASCFLKEKIRTARLALTDVTPAQLLAEEATNGNPWAPDTRAMGFISRAAFEVDDYWRVVDVLHMRLARFDRRHWREPYKALVLLEHLLTHGPASVAEEFQADTGVIKELQSFQHIDERGFNWGLAVRKKSERVLKLLERGPVLQEERDRARKLTRGIEGFGSFVHRSSAPAKGGGAPPASNLYGRSNSHYTDSSMEDDQKENSSSTAGLVAQGHLFKRREDEHEPLKENRGAGGTFNGKETGVPGVVGCGISPEESKPLLNCRTDRPAATAAVMELQKEDHPFSGVERQTAESLLLIQ
uniref:ENTH domain-containing protein C794.11c n=1 Tax=Anthurium amnicola TaxID=1678845 RepID=A0A1D1ZD59_9ARAE